MKNKIKYLSGIFMCILLQLNVMGQDALTADIMNPTFNQNCRNGKIDLHINGGFPPYDVEWSSFYRGPNGWPVLVDLQSAMGVSGNSGEEDVENLWGGVFIVKVTDALCGIVRARYTLSCVCREDCELNADVTPAICGKSGSIIPKLDCRDELTPPYNYQWSDIPMGQNQPRDRYDLGPGSYCLTVTDQDDCEINKCWTIENDQPEVLIYLKSKTNVSLCDQGKEKFKCDGSLTIELANGGDISWHNIPNSSEQHAPTVTDLCPGFYSVTVKTGSCTVTKTFKVECCIDFNEDGDENGADPISINADVQSGTGRIDLNIDGGAPTKHFVWTHDGIVISTAQNISNLAPGVYCVRVFDGCFEATGCYTIVDCGLFRIEVSDDVTRTCFEMSAGIINLSVEGENAPYEFIWDNGMRGSRIDELASGEYCVTIEDRYGCQYGPYCYIVGSKEPNVTNQQVPCTRTRECNGVVETENFETTSSLDCNILSTYCSATDMTVSEDLGWADYYIKDCDLYGVCQDGRRGNLLTLGVIIYETRVYPDFSCSTGYRCYDSYCRIDGKNYLNEDATNYCSVNAAREDDSCPTGCREDIFCDNQYMFSVCADVFCSLFNDVESRSSHLNIDDSLVVFNSIERDFYNIRATDNVRKVEPAKWNDWNVSIFPNPSNGEFNIKFNSLDSTCEIIVSSMLGQIIDYQQTTDKVLDYNVNLKEYGPGVYFVIIKNSLGNIVFQEKIISF